MLQAQADGKETQWQEQMVNPTPKELYERCRAIMDADKGKARGNEGLAG